MIIRPKKVNIKSLGDAKNIVPMLDKNTLAEISREVVKGYEIDEDSRDTWKQSIAEATDMAMQVMGERDTPWEGAANIKYPLVAMAAMDYASRAGPEILRDDRLVRGKTYGPDPDGKKYKRAENVCSYMSYDLTRTTSDWVDGTDKLLQILPILGTVFKKTYYNEVDKRICSDLCVPYNIVVNHGIQSLSSARRVTHILPMHKNDIISRQRRGIFVTNDPDGDEIDLNSLSPGIPTDPKESQQPQDEIDPELQFLEQHCYLDLDEDGYREPYIVTLHKESGTIFRIKARFKNVETTQTGKVVKIDAVQYFTDYHFLRSFDGGFYSIGYGILLLPLNKSIDSTINMLLDSGTLANLQGGIIGSGIRLKGGELKAKMGRWQNVAVAAGEEIAKNIYPWPTKEPSQVLFSLLGLLIQVGKEFTASTDIMKGDQPAQNVSGSTVSQLIEQGSTQARNINKRVYRSLSAEYQKIYDLNFEELSDKDYRNFLDDPTASVKADFEPNSMDISPIADPMLSTEAQRMLKASIVQQFPTADKRQADLYVADTMQLEESWIQRLFPEEQEPSPDMIKAQGEMQKIQAEIMNLSAQATLKTQEIQLAQAKFAQDVKFSEAQIAYYAALVFKIQNDAEHNLRKDLTTSEKMQRQEGTKEAMAIHKMNIDNHEAALKEVELAHEMTKPDKAPKDGN